MMTERQNDCSNFCNILLMFSKAWENCENFENQIALYKSPSKSNNRGCRVRLKVGGGGLGFGMDHGIVMGGVSGLGENNTTGKKLGGSIPVHPPSPWLPNKHVMYI